MLFYVKLGTKVFRIELIRKYSVEKQPLPSLCKYLSGHRTTPETVQKFRELSYPTRSPLKQPPNFHVLFHAATVVVRFSQTQSQELFFCECVIAV